MWCSGAAQRWHFKRPAAIRSILCRTRWPRSQMEASVLRITASPGAQALAGQSAARIHVEKCRRMHSTGNRGAGLCI